MGLNNTQKPQFPWSLIIAFCVFSIIIILTGTLYIKRQRESVLDVAREELQAISDLKKGQIVRWWHERIGDAILIQENRALVRQIGTFLDSDDPESREELQSWMSSVISTFDYSGACILDDTGEERLSVPDDRFATNPSTRPLIPAVFETRRVKLTDMYLDRAGGKLGLDLIIPLSDSTSGGVGNIGVMILRIDPEKILFPLIDSWQTSSKTSESLLLRADGDSVIYLNNLKFDPRSAMRLRTPAGDTTMLSTLAVTGHEGIREGFDYRGKEVLGNLVKIPGTSWYMIAKIDRTEINRDIESHIMVVRLLVIFVICAFGALTGSSIWRQRMIFYRTRYEAEAQKMALRKHFDNILKYANDIILLLDRELNIVEINDHALEVYSYTRDEIIGMHLSNLRITENIYLLEDQIKNLHETGYSRFETIHRRKDGSTFPVEISARYFVIDGTEYYQSIGRDITDRKRIESNLNELLERYNLAINVAHLAVWEWDVAKDNLIWDDRVYELYGIERDSLPAKYESWLNLLHPDDRDTAGGVIMNAIKGTGSFDQEFRVVLPDKSIRFIKAYGQVVRDEKGQPARMIGINYDITGQKTSENLLREREYWLSESQKIGNIGSYVFDIRSLTWTSSEVLDEIFGIDRDFVRTLDNWNDIVHPDYKDDMLFYVENHVIGQKLPFDREYKIINRKTGEERWVYGRGEVRVDSQGNPTVLIGTIQDITGRKAAEDTISKNRERLLSIFRVAPIGIGVVKDRNFVEVNRKVCEMTGYTEEELVGRSSRILYASGKDYDFVGNEKYSQLRKKGVGVVETKWKRKDGLIIDILLASTYLIPGDESAGLTFTALDITDRKKAEEELLVAKERAEQSDRLKTVFLHNISHEIRTPMNAIVGFTALLDEPDLDSEERKQYVNIITQSTNQLLSIISDIVDISNIETNQVKLAFSRVEINQLIKSLFEKYSPLAEQKKILFTYRIENPKGNSEIITDKSKLVQVISNLLGNALKYTTDGSIEFGYRSGKEEVEFFVRDTGIGIPADRHEKIFERFYQVENQSSRSFGGAGLGLSICKAYVELLGGRISLKSVPGKGSEFIFSHPY